MTRRTTSRHSGARSKSERGPGRPTTIAATATVIAKMAPAMVEAIDAWAAEKGTNRSDAMRQLIEAGLSRRPKP
jgi:Ribbon-helix-helix protein, copG family